ncbi:MAG: hypothetical protein HC875_37555 [Anaerolineales bacterium]|nr:hypothetical protein [Anaerolineales bacterium]
MVKDFWTESKKSQFQGRAVGVSKQRGSDVLNLNSADVIRANLELARYVKIELGEIAGISPQREGEMGNRETLGGIEMSITKSSHITEPWFAVHDNTKLRFIELVVETAKYAWRYATGDQAKKLQYTDDGLITNVFTVDGRQFMETEYGYYVSDGRSDAELITAIKTLAQAALQNDKATFKDIFTIYRDQSVASMVKKLEESERQANEREDDARREALESQENLQAQLSQIEMMKMEQTERIAMANIEKDIVLQRNGSSAKMSEAGEKEDPIAREKLMLDLKKLQDTLAQKKAEMKERSEQFYASIRSQEKRVRMQTQSAEKIARQRPAASRI